MRSSSGDQIGERRGVGGEVHRALRSDVGHRRIVEVIAGAEKAGQPVHIPGDGHFSAAGHGAVADAMIPWVESLLSEDSPPRTGP